MKELINILQELFKSDPKTAVIIVIIIVGILLFKEIIPAFWKIIESVLMKTGKLKDQNIILSEKLLDKFDTMFEKHTISFKTIISMIEIISDNQQSSLTNAQVNSLTNITFEYIKKELLYKFINEYEHNNHNFEKNIKNLYEATIVDIDRQYFQLPNTEGKVLNTSNKIESFYKLDDDSDEIESTYDKIIIILNNNDTIINKKSTLLYELNKLTQGWFTTIKNDI